jgi:hypothetical protein
VQLVARARLALGDVDVLPGDGMKRQATHVQLAAQRGLWEKLTMWSARIRATRIYTLDGGWRDVKTDRGVVKIATRTAIDHEGHVLGGRICEEDVNEDNYIAELAAQLDALLVQQARWRSCVSSRLFVEHSPPLLFHGLHPLKRVIHRAALEAR